MNDSAGAKQQIIDRIKNSTTILVTVSRDPSVDELAAALALTSFLNKLKKHATAVVSGNIPAAINFLNPNKTFENTVNSLRDFIIELNKEKADHLRYKVEGEVVKIFITPYRTTITDDDLDFSQGDYNVELVLAIGVSSEDHLDAALEAHGRILHDATVATITSGDAKSTLGSIGWHDQNASSVSEMLVGLLEPLKDERAKLDEPIATALLTGIVATTERFSNNKTTSKVMTVAAQLMAAGANQQLIAANLEDAEPKADTSSAESSNTAEQGNSDGTTDMNEGESTKIEADAQPENVQPRQSRRSKKKRNNNGELVISHEKRGDIDEISRLVAEENQAAAAVVAEEKLAEQLQSSAPAGVDNALPAVAEPSVDTTAANQAIDTAVQMPAAPVAELPPLPPQPAPQPSMPPMPPVSQVPAPQPEPKIVANMQSDEAPMLGGTLNATTEQAAEAKRLEESKDRNKKILRHGEYLGNNAPTYDSPINSVSAGEEGSVDPFGAHPAEPPKKQAGFELPAEAPTAKSSADIQPPAKPDFSGQTLADIDAANRASQPAPTHPSDAARVEVEAAFGGSDGLAFEEVPAPQFMPASQPPMPGPQPAPAVPPLPDFSTLPSLPPQMPTEAVQPQAADPFAQMPPLPMNDTPNDVFAPEAPTLQAPPAQAPSPTQFRIPGQ